MDLRTKNQLKAGDKIKDNITGNIFELMASPFNDIAGLFIKIDENKEHILSLDALNLYYFEYVQTYEKYNAKQVLLVVEKYIEQLEKEENPINRKLYIRDVCNELNIFDWWKDCLTISNLKDMKRFLKQSIKLGFKGYVSFKVGVKGCTNGMWAHTDESETGYSPDGPCLYKTFVDGYNYWSISLDGEHFIKSKKDNHTSIDTISEVKKIIEENGGNP